MTELFTQGIWGRTPEQIGQALAVIVGMVLLQFLLHSVIFRRLKKLAESTTTFVDNILVESARYPLRLSLFCLTLLLVSDILGFSPVFARWISRLAESGFIIAGTWFLSGASQLLTLSFAAWMEKRNTPLDLQVQPLFTRVLRVAVWIMGGLMLIQHLGYSITGIIASLGIGGAALAFASQDTIANVFGSAKILLDRPFLIGDWIKSTDGSIEGVVEDIGFLSTRIRTFADTLITVPNNKIANLALENFSRMTKRRIFTHIGLSYGTQIEQIQTVVPQMRQYISEHPEIEPSTLFVHFTSFSESSLDIMVYFFTRTTVWADWLRIREEIYLKFMLILQEAGIQIAVPARQLRLEHLPQGAFHDLMTFPGLISAPEDLEPLVNGPDLDSSAFSPGA
ncbi:mechanosensitive ion channel family protein [bacterium (Candidatus Blackallbacteria) CG17_big_fil_post_rev_8_21_14_2_50_48_46]|uniref:Mechanosensitive ion channel family protein n=1 Tax=bacterium (Candidatus Blackallbacteria) CG17_big_fil_post_rev_8_21_14_2_50_48_46 TaxID=2014261 RepID=A0A2M7G6Y8_9BACT|nr:MAG: mechanosensitive ion channel protein MscS [bacterium (Candidatus Blackallbacteria) CG18_big_fil_WC_8_21_14_2_50_49_26]PIW17456.1 MAG: mechanosensitive ion channel family protein [bacterium (Candidatus Blackallbacteria) CG17_big_fil_post_rev_8_21_14_2_50_48_46]PIW48310.1 MAG: mechanosensitive ion channel family protein [bacterium (Candidatus Blackallbacteria) CG13_big_fil_rev_8_21_14_2_50_49_14]